MLGVLPGTDARLVRRLLADVGQQAQHTRGATSDPDTFLRSYLRWARTSADRLHGVLLPERVDGLIRTPTYWSMLPVSAGTRAIFETLQAELDACSRALDMLESALGAEHERWSHASGPLVVLDTNIFLEHTLEFGAALAAVEDAVAPVRPDDIFDSPVPVQHIVCLQVVDELDKAKSDRVRTRARKALAALNEMFADPGAPAELDGLRAGSSVHLLMDDRDHQRLPDADSEIVDQAVYLSAFAGTAGVSVATFDAGMALRARAAGVGAARLTDKRA